MYLSKGVESVLLFFYHFLFLFFSAYVFILLLIYRLRMTSSLESERLCRTIFVKNVVAVADRVTLFKSTAFY